MNRNFLLSVVAIAVALMIIVPSSVTQAELVVIADGNAPQFNLPDPHLSPQIEQTTTIPVLDNPYLSVSFGAFVFCDYGHDSLAPFSWEYHEHEVTSCIMLERWEWSPGRWTTVYQQYFQGGIDQESCVVKPDGEPEWLIARIHGARNLVGGTGDTNIWRLRGVVYELTWSVAGIDEESWQSVETKYEMISPPFLWQPRFVPSTPAPDDLP